MRLLTTLMLAVVILASCAPSDPNHPKFVVAKAKDIKILRSDLDVILAPRLEALSERSTQISPQQKYSMDLQVLETLLLKEIIYHEAIKLGKETAIQSKVDEAVKRIHDKYKTAEEREVYFTKAKTDLSKIEANARDRAARQLVLEEHLKDTVEIPEEDILAFYEKTKSKWNAPERVQVLESVVRQDANDDAESSRKLAEELRAMLEAGKTASEMNVYLKEKNLRGKAYARAFTYSKGRVDPKTEQELFEAKEGSVSEVLETRRGLHVFKVEKKLPEDIKQFEDVQSRVTALIKRSKKVEQQRNIIEKLKADAAIEIFLSEPAVSEISASPSKK
ncbi:MAG: peptidyl-prolyl cis-trans isomerase [Verrucomicrobiota bacterium]